MQAVKVFNNNAVSVVMPDGREAILVGNGLGFGRRPGDVIDKSRVSKVYYVQNELQTKFLKMLDNVTPQVMQAAERISLAAEEQGILLSSKSTISLVDHISFALERVEKGTFLPNLMLSETRMLYPKEYAVGQRALELVRQFCGVQLLAAVVLLPPVSSNPSPCAGKNWKWTRSVCSTSTRSGRTRLPLWWTGSCTRN